MRRAQRPSGFCPECGAWRDSLHRDHVVPRWKGGGDDEDNIQYLCANCHEEKTRVDLTGRRNSDEAIARTRAKNTGQKRTAEAREKMSESALGKTYSLQTRAKIASALKGRKRPAEVYAKAKRTLDAIKAQALLGENARRAAVSVPPSVHGVVESFRGDERDGQFDSCGHKGGI